MSAESVNAAIKQLMMQGVALGHLESKSLKVEVEKDKVHNFALTVGTSGSVGIHYAPREYGDTQNN